MRALGIQPLSKHYLLATLLAGGNDKTFSEIPNGYHDNDDTNDNNRQTSFTRYNPISPHYNNCFGQFIKSIAIGMSRTE